MSLAPVLLAAVASDGSGTGQLFVISFDKV
jgi:hypothetical protein